MVYHPTFFYVFLFCSETLKDFLLSVFVCVRIKEDVLLLLTSTFMPPPPPVFQLLNFCGWRFWVSYSWSPPPPSPLPLCPRMTPRAGLKWQKQPPRQFSKISVLFFQEQPFYNFPGGSICSSNRHEFSGRVYMFFEQTRIFQEGLSKRHVFSRRFYLFIEQTFLSHRTDTNFPKNPYLVLEHIRIFQESLFCHRTDTHFPGSPI